MAQVRRTICWGYKIILPAGLREELEASRGGVSPWSEALADGGVIRGRGRHPSRSDAELAAKGARAYILDQYTVRPKTATAPVSAEAEKRNKNLDAIRAVVVRVVHKPYDERHLIGYRVDVVGYDGVRRRMMSVPGAPESLVRPRTALLSLLTPFERGTLIRGRNAKAAVRELMATISVDGSRAYRIAVYKRGPQPGPVAPEVAQAHRADACAKRKRFTSMKAAFAATNNARKRGVPLTPHGCQVCGGFHVAYRRNQVTT